MSIVHLIVKQEMVLNLIYLFSECKENATFRTTVQMSYIMVLYIE